MAAPKLSPRLSPQAKQLVLQAGKQVVAGAAEVSAVADPAALRKGVEGLGGKVRTAAGAGRVMTFEVPADQLSKLADLDGVMYVASAERVGK